MGLRDLTPLYQTLLDPTQLHQTLLDPTQLHQTLLDLTPLLALPWLHLALLHSTMALLDSSSLYFIQ